MGDDLLVVTPKGKIALIAPNGDVEFLVGNVPMNLSGWESNESFDMQKKQNFRVTGYSAEVERTVCQAVRPVRHAPLLYGQVRTVSVVGDDDRVRAPPPPPNIAHSVSMSPSWENGIRC